MFTSKRNCEAPDLKFTKIKDDSRYWPYFEGCISVIAGTHIFVIVPTKDQIRYIGRKGYPMQNVMVVCNLDMLIIFVVVGWPGTVNDTHILTSVLEEKKNVFHHHFEGTINLFYFFINKICDLCSSDNNFYE